MLRWNELRNLAIVVLVVDVLLTSIWTKRSTNDKFFTNSHNTVIVLFAIGCFISAFFLGLALRRKPAKKSFLIILFVLSIIGAVGGVLLAILISAIENDTSFTLF
jgi:uncharacterized membrane protein YfhO